jgi:hypothetical protein
MEAVEKYERKLQRENRKRGRQSGCEHETEEEDQQTLKKIQKYEKKLKKAMAALGRGATGTSVQLLTSGAPTTTEIDKSGMTLLLFYAYVEPIWKPAEHAEVMRWAQSTLDSYGLPSYPSSSLTCLCRCHW